MYHSRGGDVLKDGIGHDFWTLHECDSRKLRSQFREWFTPEALEEGVLDVTITSPPYADMKNYQGGEEVQIGFGDSYAEYLTQLQHIFKYLYEVTAPTGSLWVVVNSFRNQSEFVQLQSDIIDICENLQQLEACPSCDGELYRHRTDNRLVCPVCEVSYDPAEDSWQIQDMIIWNKTRALPYASKHSFRNVFEYILWFSKTDEPTFDIDSVRIADTQEFEHWWVDWPERYHPHGKVPENIWTMLSPSQGAWGDKDYQHPAPFPPQLVERIIRLTTDPGDIVFDPFGGTGTVPIQANLMDRRAFGCEVSQKYLENCAAVEANLEQRWEGLKEEGTTLEQQQQQLAEVIWGLRQLVFTKRLYRELESAADWGPSSVVNTVFIRSHDLSPYGKESVQSTLDIIFDPSVTEEAIEVTEQQLRQYPSQQPFSGFGLDVTVNCWTVPSFLDQVDTGPLTDRRLFLYPEGTHHRYAQTIALDQWQSAINAPDRWRATYGGPTYPPLISNISIQINRKGDIPTVERGIDDQPPKETGYEYTENVTSRPTETKLTDF